MAVVTLTVIGERIKWLHGIPYPLEYNHGVIFFKMGFWVRFNSKNPSKSGLFDQKMGFYSRKTPKTGFLKKVMLYSRVGLYTSGYSIFFPLEPKIISELSTFEKVIVKNKHDKFKYKAA